MAVLMSTEITSTSGGSYEHRNNTHQWRVLMSTEKIPQFSHKMRKWKWLYVND